MADETKTPQTIGSRRSRSRRDLLKALATGGGAVAVSQVLPEKWVKPLVDKIVLPLHAQSTGSFLLNPTVRLEIASPVLSDDDGDDDAPPQVAQVFDGADSGVDGRVVEIDGTGGSVDCVFLPMDFTLSGTISPAVDQSVSVVVTMDTDLDTGADVPLAPVVSNGSGAFTFPVFGTGADDLQPDSATFTFSTAGAPNAVITITFGC